MLIWLNVVVRLPKGDGEIAYNEFREKILMQKRDNT